jgi:tetratricopeptide (TPR) repeat protein
MKRFAQSKTDSRSNPNSAALFAQRGWIEAELGRFDEAKSDSQRAIRLSPRDPEMGDWHLDLGDAELGLGHYDAAIEEFRMADDSGCCLGAPYWSLAAAYGLKRLVDLPMGWPDQWRTLGLEAPVRTSASQT